jgi:IclR helix-turn-helix domain
VPVETDADTGRLLSQKASGRPLRRIDRGEGTVIELSPAQIDRVIRSAAEGGSMSVLMSGLMDVREVLAREPSQMEDSRLSRSLLAGLLMLASFPTDGSYLGNAEIARMLDMNPSTTHRYVSTLVAVGLLERDPATRRYRLA